MQILKKALGAIALLTSLTVYDSNASGRDGLETLPSMHTARAAHTLTTLRDGSVLVVGGFISEETRIAGVELFDPQGRQFRALANPLNPRQNHAATLLHDGRVLITGGYDAGGRHVDTAEIFDPATRRFAAAGRMAVPRSGHSAMTLDDGRVVLIGGGSNDWTILDSIEIYDPKTGRFTEAGKMMVPRGGHVAVLMRDGRILIAGGHTGRRDTLKIYDSSEIFDPRNGRSSAAAPMSSPRDKHDGVLLADGCVLITGGSDGRVIRTEHAEVFDPTRNTFAPVGPMNKPRFKHRGSSVLLPNGKVLIAGGAQQAELYDPVTETFSLVESTSMLRGHFSAVTLLRDGRALITGGYLRADTTSDGAWLYAPAAANVSAQALEDSR